MTVREEARAAVVGVLTKLDSYSWHKIDEPFVRSTREDAIRAAALLDEPVADTEWEYGIYDLTDDADQVILAFETRDLADHALALCRGNYPWPEELTVGRRRKASAWEVVEGE